MLIPECVKDCLGEFHVDDDQLRRISLLMVNEFQLGLEYGKTATSSIAMLPSFVPAVPDGSGVSELGVNSIRQFFRIGQIHRHRFEWQEFTHNAAVVARREHDGSGGAHR
jgi:hypothetical protein